MNKEEIEKEDKEHLIEVLTEHKDYIFEFDDDNIKIEYILDYIRELEFQNTALKAEYNHNTTRIKELEQKETILDKVTDKLKEDIKNNYCIEETTGDFYIEIGIKKYLVKPYAQEITKILNVIEGENNGN